MDLFEDLHYNWRQYMHSEEAEIVSGPHTRNDKTLLGLCGGGFLGNRLHPVQALMARKPPAADSAVSRK